MIIYYILEIFECWWLLATSEAVSIIKWAGIITAPIIVETYNWWEGNQTFKKIKK